MNQKSTFAILIVILSLTAAGSTAAQGTEKHVFVTVLDSSGAPIEGLTADHFAVRESGKERPVDRVEPLRTAMHLAVLVDTSAVTAATDLAFRKALLEFVEQLAAFNHVAVYASGDRAAPVVPFTQDPAQLRSGMAGMFAWAHTRSHLIDTVDLALRDLARIESPRPVIVAITAETPEASRTSAGSAVKRLIAQSTAFHVISLASATGSGGVSTMGANVETSSQRLQGMIATGEGDKERTRIYQLGTSATGGSVQRLTSTLAFGPAFTRLARELSSGYRLTFTTQGSGRIKDLQVGIMVDGATLRAIAAPSGTK
jgi:VWFA-related protein